jgi:hypothetical protein
LADIWIGRDASRGVGLLPTYALPKSSYSLDLKVLTIPSNMGYGSIGDGNAAMVAQRWAQGTIEGDLLAKPFGIILTGIFGAAPSSGAPADSATTHTFTLLNSNNHASLSIVRSDEVDSQLFEFAMLNKFELSVVPDDVVKFNVEFVSKEPQDSVDPSVAPSNKAYIANNKWLGRHASVKIASLTSGLAAASVLSLKSFKLQFVKNVKPNFVLGTLGPEDIINQKFEITGEIELDYTNETYRNLIRNNTYQAMRFNLNNVDALIGVTSTPQFTIDLSRVYFEAWEPAFPLDDLVGQKFTFRALYDITNGNIVNSCTLVNAVTSY